MSFNSLCERCCSSSDMTLKLHKSSGQEVKQKVEQDDELDMKNSLQYALRPLLWIAQVFGVLPLSGLWRQFDKTFTTNAVKFKWFCPNSCLAYIFTFLAFTEFGITFQKVAEKGLGIRTTGPFEFATVCVCSYILFIKCAYDWSHIMQQTQQCEQNFLRKMYANAESRRFSRQIYLIVGILLVGAFAEHLCYKSQIWYEKYQLLKACNSTANLIDFYYKDGGVYVLHIFGYHRSLIPLKEWCYFALTFAWNFLDIFITIMAKSLTIRFRQVYDFILQHKHKQMPGVFWCKLREDILSLLEVLSCYDAKFSGLILLACTNNLYYLCMQIFYSFRSMPNDVYKVYFWCSLSFVFFRILFMLFNAAAVHDVSQRLVSLIYEIPSSHWCLELERLNEVLVSDTIALSGHKFFTITRGLILAMLGNIIIYELVLLDKMQDDDDDDDDDNNGELNFNMQICLSL